MIFLIGVYGYVLYVLLLIGHHAVRHQQLTKQRRLLVNIIAPGMGYYYNNEIRRPALFFSVAVILAGFYLVGIPMWLVPMSMLFLLALCEGYAWREQSLMQQMKRLEACTHKRPIVALNAAQVVNYMSAEFNVSQKLDRRTIYSHFIDLQKLSECYPEHVNFTFYRKANGAAYITVDQ